MSSPVKEVEKATKEISWRKSVKLAAIVVATIVVFIFMFATASSWILFTETALPCIFHSTPATLFNAKAYGLFALVLTVTTIGLSLAFAFATRNTQAKVPIDFNTLIKNVQVDVDEAHSNRKHKLYMKKHPFEL